MPTWRNWDDHLASSQALIDDFMAKGPESVSRMNTINSFNENNFNRTLVGVSDPTHPDSDSDGIPDGWDIAMLCMEWTIRQQKTTGQRTH